MIEIKIPKEIQAYETKFIGMFTFRQSVCLALTVPVCIWIFNNFKDQSMDLAGGLCMIPAAFAWLFGWLKIYGMRFEEFIMTAAVSSVIAPMRRKYMTNNIYSRSGKKKKYKKSKNAVK